mmetsp:Transcript_4337/g.18471  ORF Transcript_4337/g.18471 Transcript_4337/m.18471 type:complete len:86 (-) Transcript_4337:1422-1679(-)
MRSLLGTEGEATPSGSFVYRNLSGYHHGYQNSGKSFSHSSACRLLRGRHQSTLATSWLTGELNEQKIRVSDQWSKKLFLIAMTVV